MAFWAEYKWVDTKEVDEDGELLKDKDDEIVQVKEYTNLRSNYATP
jgi:hypothetical protein